MFVIFSIIIRFLIFPIKHFPIYFRSLKAGKLQATNLTRVIFTRSHRSNYSPFFFNPLPHFSSALVRIIAIIYIEQTILINSSCTTIIVNAVSLKNFRLILFILVTAFPSVKSDQWLKSIEHFGQIFERLFNFYRNENLGRSLSSVTSDYE